MANTTNLDLVKPAGTDKALVSVINSNSDKIDAFAGTTNQALASIEWGPESGASLLSFVLENAQRTKLPFSFVKYNSGTISDLPELGVTEFTGIVTGSGARMNVLVMQYGSGRIFSRTIFQNAWLLSDWQEFTIGRYVNAVVPVSTAAGSYKVGTFSSLGIPTSATIVSAQTSNELQSVCHVIGFGVSGSDIYVELLDPVQVADGNVRITYQL